jgi:acyl-coenzyme A thioesterase PaaI-like protein
MITLEDLKRRGTGFLPGYMGIVITGLADNEIRAELTVQRHHIAPNGYLHAGTVVTLADTACGYGCIAHLPEGAKGFTTIELKSSTSAPRASVIVRRVPSLNRTINLGPGDPQGQRQVIALFAATRDL